MKKILVIASIVLCMVGLAPMGWAESGLKNPVQIEQKSYILDGKEYSKEKLIEDFINIAFSKKEWPIDTGEYYQVPAIIIGWEESYPWLAEYLVRSKGVPKPNVLQKWEQKNVRIGFDWPLYTFNKAVASGKQMALSSLEESEYLCGYQSEHCTFFAELKRGDHQELVNHIESILLQLEKLTALNLKLQKPNDEAEKTSDYARIRIVPVGANRQKNFFKMYRFEKGAEGDPWYLRYHEADIIGAISYTTDIRSQVDGYLIPEHDNTLGLSVCKIMPVVGNDMMKALVTECLLRALGLPDISQLNDRTMLGNWNKQYDAFSKLKDLDGRETALRKEQNYVPSSAEFPKIKGDIEAYTVLHDYDKMMIKLLYCPALYSGMSRNDAMDILHQSDECFQNVKQ